MKPLKTAFLFPGQGSYFPGILSDSIQSHSTFKKYLEETDLITHRFFGTRISDFIAQYDTAAAQEKKPVSFELSQFAIFLTAFLHFHILKGEGVQADVVLGHSFGEIAAFAAAEIISFETALKIVAYRTKTLTNLKIQGSMTSFGCDSGKAQKLIDFAEVTHVYVSNINSPNQTVLSGKTDELKKVATSANALGISTIPLGTAYPFHCRMMESAGVIFQEMLGKLDVQDNRDNRDVRDVHDARDEQSQRIEVFSPVSLQFYTSGIDLGEHLTRRLFGEQVRFLQTINQLYRMGVRSFIEVGGKKTLASLAKDTLKDVQDTLITSTHTQWKAAVEAYQKFNLPEKSLTLSLSEKSLFAAPKSWNLASLSTTELLGKASEIMSELNRRNQLFLDVAASGAQIPIAAPHRVEGDKLDGKLEAIAPATPVSAEPQATQSTAAIQSTPAIHSTLEIQPTSAAQSIPKVDHHLQKQVLAIYQTMTEYPEEVLELDVDLESELGLDSVKQIQILGKIQESFNLPPKQDLQIKTYNTIRKIIEMVATSTAIA